MLVLIGAKWPKWDDLRARRASQVRRRLTVGHGHGIVVGHRRGPGLSVEIKDEARSILGGG